MKKLILFPLMTMFLVSCANENKVIAEEHDYSDVNHLFICWDDIFEIKDRQYFVYIYSETCGHCQEIKQDIISYALNHDSFYFIKFNSEIPIINDRNLVIGKNKVEELGIVGTPSMFLITGNIVEANYVGKKEIITTLTNSK